MNYVLDSELAALATGFPKLDLADLASTREVERTLLGQLPKYETRIALAVHDVAVPRQGASRHRCDR